MATVTKLGSSQDVQSIVFDVNATDTMVNTSGNSVAFGAITSGSNTVFDVATLPPGSVVVGGRVIVITAWNSTVNTVDVGDSDDTDRYTETGAVDLQDADAPASAFDMLGDGKFYTNGQNLRLTFNNTVAAATAGRAIVVVNYVIVGRSTYNLKTT